MSATAAAAALRIRSLRNAAAAAAAAAAAVAAPGPAAVGGAARAAASESLCTGAVTSSPTMRPSTTWRKPHTSMRIELPARARAHDLNTI